jgi:Fe-S-cluster-containing hydrogenase component 2
VSFLEEYERTGVFTLEELRDKIPPSERMRRGKVAMIECLQKIPCDACAKACQTRVISKSSIIEPPDVDFEKCFGCGKCVVACPGLAIFLLQIKDGKGLVTIPYEFLPLPKKDQLVEALDRNGKPVGKAKIIAVVKNKDKTNLVTFEVDEEIVMKARNIKVI